MQKAEIEKLKEYCRENRENIIKMVYNAQSGHIGGSLSATELVTVLFHKCMKLAPKWDKDKNFETRDRFVLSKGHVSPIYYCNLAQMGYFPKEELMTLSGIGEARAEDILEYRKKYGSFSSIEDIMNISGIGEKMFEKIKDDIEV